VVRQFLNISIDSACCQSSGICGEQYQSDVVFNHHGMGIAASRLRFQLQPLRNEEDFIGSYATLRQALRQLAGLIPERYPGQRTSGGTSDLAFPYSLYFVFYEQYTYIQGVAVADLLLALAAVFLCTALLTSLATAALIVAMVASVLVNVAAVMLLWNAANGTGLGQVRINAVSVVNMVMSAGLSVEFVVHVASAFLHAPGSREQRARRALASMGASVFSGITLTKLVGIAVLAVAPSHLFRVYYFRMYTALIIMGAFQGLAVLPVLLSFIGPPEARATHETKMYSLLHDE
jgi:Niemann-Pick C1 protein